MSEDSSAARAEKSTVQVSHVKADVPPPPNGGLRAWLQVAGGFCIFMTTWGIINMFGVFQSYYEAELLRGYTSSQISWIGSVQASLLFFVSSLTGPLYDLGYMVHLLWTGSLLAVLGIMLTSICHEYWQVFLAHGVMVGIGDGLLFLCCIAVVGQYFTTRKTFATGIAATGGSVGGIIYPVIFNRLVPSIGFGWTTRIIGFIVLAASILPVLGLRQRIPPSARRDLLRTTEFKSLPFFFFNLGTFFGFMAIYVVFFYIQIYAIERTNIDANLSTYIVTILNAGGLVGRLVPNFFADKFGCLNMQMPCAILAAVVAFCWIDVRSAVGVAIFAPFYALVAGAFSSLPGPTIVSLSPTLEGLGTRIGMNLFITALGVLLGPPIAGAILGSDRNWVGVQVWCGILLAIAGACMFAARVARNGG